MLQSGCRWRDCPTRYGPCTTVYNRWNRWTHRAVWQRLFEALRQSLAERRFPGDRQHDGEGSPLGGGRKRGAQAQAIGRSRGGRTTKVYAVCDPQGRPTAFAITPRQLGDLRATSVLLACLPPTAFCAADGAYDANGFGAFLIERGTTPVIPNNVRRKNVHPFDRDAYRRRNIIERMF